MAEGDWSHRLAGGLVVVLGLFNVLFGVLSLATGLVRLSAAVASGLVAAGLVTAAAGVLVWRGSRLTTYVTLTVFGLLLVSQLGDAVTTPSANVVDPAGNAAVRLGVLGVVVAALGLAAWRLRRRRVSG